MLPYEVDDALPTSTAKLLWPIKFLKECLGLQNEAQCRDWFAKHPDVLKACLDCHRELEVKIQEIQDKARRGLETIVAQETLCKYELQPRADLRALERCDAELTTRKRVLESDDDASEMLTSLFDKNAQKIFKDTVKTIIPALAPVLTALVNQNTKRVKF